MLIVVVFDLCSKLGLFNFHLKKIHDETRIEELVSTMRKLLVDLHKELNETFSSATTSREHVLL